MPEQYVKSPRLIWPLSYAVDRGQLVWVECGYCRGRRWYLPADLKRLFGNVDVNTIARRMKCERCGRRDNMEADVFVPIASERARMTIRRLVEIQVRKIPVWRDESG